MPKHPKVVTISSFKGLNNVLKPEKTSPEYLKKAINVNLDKQGGISKRKGYTLISSGNYTSIWANNLKTKCYLVKDGDLLEMLPDYSTILIRSSVGTDPISFEEVDGVIYYSSYSVKGIIENDTNRSFGLDKVTNTLPLTVSSGSLIEGSYQVAYTYVDSDGRESGTSKSNVIFVLDGSGISLTVPTPSNPDISSARIYCTTTNGTVLYFKSEVALGSTYVITDTFDLSNPLRTFNLDSPPYAKIVKYYKGRLFMAEGNILWYSEPNQYELYDLTNNYIQFPDTIKEVMPVEDGIWIGSDNIYYLSGSDPDNFKLTLKERAQVVEGSSTRFSGSYILLDNTPIGYKWLVTTNLGIFVVFNQGLIINLTATNLSLKRADKGTSVFLQDGGMNQYLSILKQNNKTNNSVIGDLVETTIVRNGITIG